MRYTKDAGYGQALLSGIASMVPTFGRIFVVFNSSDTDERNYQMAQEIFTADPDGLARFYTSLSTAYAAVESNGHDVLALDANSGHAVTAMLDVSKNRTHFISMGGRSGSFGMGARSRVTMGVTTAATDIAVMKNTGVGNTFEGLKFDSSNTVAEGLYAIAEGGEYAIYKGCEFYKSTDLDETAAAEVLNNGDSAQWLDCVFGSSANIVADNKIRPNMLLSATLSGKKCRDNIIDNCLFLSKAGGTEHVAIYGANATDVERMLLVKNSTFLNNALSAATPAHAVGFGSAQTQGSVLLQNCASADHTVMAEASVGIFTSNGAAESFAAGGVAVTT